MDFDILIGIIRLFLPLLCISLAAVWFNRIGLINIALDSQIGLGSATYVAATFYVSPILAVILSFAMVAFIGIVLVEAKERYSLDPLLVGLGLLYFGYGGAQVISQVIAGTPGYAQLQDMKNLGEQTPFWLMVMLAVGTCVCLVSVRALRIAKVISDAPELAAIQGISKRWWSHLHSIVAATLITAASVYLSEHGGSFTSGIAGERGFLALAFVAVAVHRIWVVAGLCLFFGTLQKLGYEGIWPIEIFEALTYFIAIALVVWSGVRTSKNFRKVIGNNL